MDDTPQAPDPGLVFLKWLVIALTGTMLAGLIVLIVLFVTRFPTAAPPLPDRLVLPDGVEAEAFTMGRGWMAVVTGAGEILIYDAATLEITQRIAIETAE